MLRLAGRPAIALIEPASLVAALIADAAADEERTATSLHIRRLREFEGPNADPCLAAARGAFAAAANELMAHDQSSDPIGVFQRADDLVWLLEDWLTLQGAEGHG